MQMFFGTKTQSRRVTESQDIHSKTQYLKSSNPQIPTLDNAK